MKLFAGLSRLFLVSWWGVTHIPRHLNVTHSHLASSRSKGGGGWGAAVKPLLLPTSAQCTLHDSSAVFPSPRRVLMSSQTRGPRSEAWSSQVAVGAVCVNWSKTQDEGLADVAPHHLPDIQHATYLEWVGNSGEERTASERVRHKQWGGTSGTGCLCRSWFSTWEHCCCCT